MLKSFSGQQVTYLFNETVYESRVLKTFAMILRISRLTPSPRLLGHLKRGHLII